MNIQPCVYKQTVEETLQIIKKEKYIEHKVSEEVAMLAVWSVHVEALRFHGSTYWTTYFWPFEAIAWENNLTEKDIVVSFKMTCGRASTESAI